MPGCCRSGPIWRAPPRVLAGTASGLGGAILIGGGAGLAAFAGVLLGPGATEMPLILLMLGSSLASVVAILFVIRRARQIAA